MKRDEQMTDESAESEYEKSQRVYEQCQLRILLEIDVLQFSVAVRQTKTCFHMYPPSRQNYTFPYTVILSLSLFVSKKKPRLLSQPGTWWTIQDSNL